MNTSLLSSQPVLSNQPQPSNQPELATLPAFSRASQCIKSSDVRELLRHAHLPNIISLAGGMPATELFDMEGLQQATQNVFAQTHRLAFQYGATEGQAALLESIRDLMRKREITLTQHRLLISTGSQQGLDLIARALLNPGDSVIVERPCYLAAIQVFNLAQAEFIELDSDENGAQIEKLDRLCAGKKPKLMYIVSNFSNPTGASLALERRKQLIKWAVNNGVFILEDDPYGELRFRGAPILSLLSLAETMQANLPNAPQHILYISSLSKIIAPGLRLGWLALPQRFFDTVARLKQATDLQTASVTQSIAAEYLNLRRLPTHIDKIRAHYKKQLSALIEALHQHFKNLIEFNEPEGGMFIWAKFRTAIDTQKLLEKKKKKGVIFVPGASFYPSNAETASIRLSYVSVSPEQLREGIKRLREAYDDYMNHTSQNNLP